MITIRGNSPNECRACTRPQGASRKLRPSVVVTLSPRYIQSPQQTLICVMRPAIFMLHLFAGNFLPADLTPRSQRPAAAHVGMSKVMTPVWKILLVLNTAAGQERLRRLEQTMKGCGGPCSSQHTTKQRDPPAMSHWHWSDFQRWCRKKTNLTEQNFNECHVISFFSNIFAEKTWLKTGKSVKSSFRTHKGGESPSVLTSLTLSSFHNTLPSQAEVLSSLKRWELGEIILTPFWQLAILSQTLKQPQKKPFFFLFAASSLDLK